MDTITIMLHGDGMVTVNQGGNKAHQPVLVVIINQEAVSVVVAPFVEVEQALATDLTAVMVRVGAASLKGKLNFINYSTHDIN